MDRRWHVFRNITSQILLIILSILIISVPAFAQADDYVRYDGIWETGRGPLALWQAGDAVYGVFGSNGTLGGHVNADGILNFSYEDGPDEVGTGRFVMNDDLVSFIGLYSSRIDQSESGSWNGNYLGPNGYEVDDRAALNYNAGEIPSEEEVAEPVAPEEIEPGEEIEPTEFFIDQENSWNGTWDTGRGYLVLTASETTVIGSFGETGIFQGGIDGDTLLATWSMTGENGSELDGEAVFTLASDGLSFRGTYSQLDIPNLWLPWMGTKVTRSVIEPEPEPDSEPEPVIVPELVIEREPEPNVEEQGYEEIEEPQDEPQPVPEEIEIEEPEPEPEAEPVDEGYSLKLTATGDCWTIVRIRDARLYIGTLVEGDELEFIDDYGFYISAGAPEYLIVEFNGEIIKWAEYQTFMEIPAGADVYTPPESDE